MDVFVSERVTKPNNGVTAAFTLDVAVDHVSEWCSHTSFPFMNWMAFVTFCSVCYAIRVSANTVISVKYVISKIVPQPLDVNMLFS